MARRYLRLPLLLRLMDSHPIVLALLLSDLGLDSIKFISPATSSINASIYFIQPYVDSFSVGLNELYNYTFTNGLIYVNRMPLVITPRDTTFVYGQEISGIQYNFSYTDSLIPPDQRAGFLDSLMVDYEGGLSSGACSA